MMQNQKLSACQGFYGVGDAVAIGKLAVLKGQLVAIVDVGLKREIVKLIEKVWGHKFPI
jgi:hypothetical protein